MNGSPDANLLSERPAHGERRPLAKIDGQEDVNYAPSQPCPQSTYLRPPETVITTYKVSNMRAIPNCAKPPPVGRYLSRRQLNRLVSGQVLAEYCHATIEMDNSVDRPINRLTHRQRKRILRMSVFIPEEAMSSVLFDGYTSNTVVFGNGAPVGSIEVLYPASHVVSPALDTIPSPSIQDSSIMEGGLHLGKGIDDECVAGPQNSPLLVVEPVLQTDHLPYSVPLQSLPVSGFSREHVHVVSTAPLRLPGLLLSSGLPLPDPLLPSGELLTSGLPLSPAPPC